MLREIGSSQNNSVSIGTNRKKIQEFNGDFTYLREEEVLVRGADAQDLV